MSRTIAHKLGAVSNKRFSQDLSIRRITWDGCPRLVEPWLADTTAPHPAGLQDDCNGHERRTRRIAQRSLREVVKIVNKNNGLDAQAAQLGDLDELGQPDPDLVIDEIDLLEVKIPLEPRGYSKYHFS